MKPETFFDLVRGLRYFGKGVSITRAIFKIPDTYWIVHRVKLSKDQRHGTAWGSLVWRGRHKPEVVRIAGTLKKEWTLVAFPDYHSFKGKMDAPPEAAKIDGVA